MSGGRRSLSCTVISTCALNRTGLAALLHERDCRRSLTLTTHIIGGASFVNARWASLGGDADTRDAVRACAERRTYRIRACHAVGSGEQARLRR